MSTLYASGSRIAQWVKILDLQSMSRVRASLPAGYFSSKGRPGLPSREFRRVMYKLTEID